MNIQTEPQRLICPNCRGKLCKIKDIWFNLSSYAPKLKEKSIYKCEKCGKIFSFEYTLYRMFRELKDWKDDAYTNERRCCKKWLRRNLANLSQGILSAVIVSQNIQVFRMQL